ncbi:MAG: hypothetical protein A2722_00480 [Candidatus Doudnabacteria bacterium RIFCSPHIGHO2_01_FULL_50_11]|uniref:Uncharacterized protein n=1 Tax=Candidatus Doudnabacteria bacterium RIFCSPHIGHO2_01_FULL_50_11 TaxID=1817828 RepID=A0A1F5PGZ7_9BACT|nr:MAG: hypothetical protein A2722_00480 [Candidatus Doudnabacteria bacterium RIFCSPHIGHO2_01_FULL_50_11]HLC44358.1 hypothetical protein [Patescibacteria group bacterium]
MIKIKSTDNGAPAWQRSRRVKKILAYVLWRREFDGTVPDPHYIAPLGPSAESVVGGEFALLLGELERTTEFNKAWLELDHPVIQSGVLREVARDKQYQLSLKGVSNGSQRMGRHSARRW